MRSRPRGRSGCRLDGGGGSRSRIAVATSFASAPGNALRPVSISNSKAPNAKMSVAVIDGLAGNLLGRHVGGSARNQARKREIGRPIDRRPFRERSVSEGRGLGQAKVEQFGLGGAGCLAPLTSA